MNNHSTRPVKLGKTLCVLELQEDAGQRAGFVKVLASIPGRSGHMERVWDCPNGSMDAAQFNDFQAWVLDTLLNAVLCSKGVALQLFRE